MAIHVIRADLQELVQQLGGVVKPVLKHSNLSLSVEATDTVLVDDRFKGNVSHVEDLLVQEEVYEVHEEVVVLLRVQTLVLGLHISVVDNLNLQVDGLGAEVLRQVVLRSEVAKSSHALHFSNGFMLASHFRPPSQFV